MCEFLKLLALARHKESYPLGFMVSTRDELVAAHNGAGLPPATGHERAVTELPAAPPGSSTARSGGGYLGRYTGHLRRPLGESADFSTRGPPAASPRRRPRLAMPPGFFEPETDEAPAFRAAAATAVQATAADVAIATFIAHCVVRALTKPGQRFSRLLTFRIRCPRSRSLCCGPSGPHSLLPTWHRVEASPDACSHSHIGDSSVAGNQLRSLPRTTHDQTQVIRTSPFTSFTPERPKHQVSRRTPYPSNAASDSNRR